MVAEAGDGYEALQKAQETHPDVAILDIAMPRMNGLLAAPKLKRISPHTRLILLSMYDDASYVREALRAGVHGYVLKCEVASALISAIHRVMAGEYAFAPPVLRTIVGYAHQSMEGPGTSLDLLTDREREVLQLIAEGYSNKEIAKILGRSLETVRHQRASLMKKLDLHRTADLVRYAISCGLITPKQVPLR